MDLIYPSNLFLFEIITFYYFDKLIDILYQEILYFQLLKDEKYNQLKTYHKLENIFNFVHF